MYWLVLKFTDGTPNYIAGFDEHGRPHHTKDSKKALRFYNCGTAATWMKEGYFVSKRS